MPLPEADAVPAAAESQTAMAAMPYLRPSTSAAASVAVSNPASALSWQLMVPTTCMVMNMVNVDLSSPYVFCFLSGCGSASATRRQQNMALTAQDWE